MAAENADSSSASSPKKEDDTWTMKLESAMTTDRRRWRLKDDRGRHTWHYLVTEEEARDWPLTTADKYFLKLPLDLSNLAPAKTAIEAAENGLDFFEKLQLPSGHWGGECSGPVIFLGGFVIAWYITKTPIPTPNAIEMRNWLFSTANPDDGGWGLNQDGHSNVCGTVLSYTALRILGVQADDPVMAKARIWLHQMGGAVNSSLWGKFWLAVLGVVDWDIVSPIPPEIWLLPDWLPLSPSRLYIEMRAVALPVSYMSSRRLSCQETDITRSLKAELFTQPITEIKWAFHRRSIAPVDNIYPRPYLLEVVTWVYLNVWKPYFCTDSIKKRAESWVSHLIDMEVENMGYLNMAATNAPMNTTLCYFRDGPGSLNVSKQIKRLNDYLWMTENGMLINSTNGDQCWDLALVVQTVCECGLEGNQRWRPMLLKALEFLDHHQIKENCKDQEICYRQPRKGGWAFSTKDQGVPVSDCVAEVLKAVILLQQSGHYPKALEDRRIFDAVDVILEYQNRSGGVSAFEARRGGPLLEMLNPSQIYGRLMVEYDYPECTTSCLTALVLFQKHWPAYRSKEIGRFVQKAAGWIKTNQRADGSWYGTWGICFTYATMFALESLASTGETYANNKSSQRACHFLLSHQRSDGGWSESFKACETMEYHEDPRGSLVVQTAWALIGLMNAEYPHVEPLLNGVRLIMGRQQDNGEWLSEAIEGAFHDFGAFSYPNYKFSFTIRALGMFSRRFPHIKVDVSRE